jgi:hypothetical protein
LPPCRNGLREHLKRVNYQVGIWKRAHIAKPVYPEPTHDNGWQCVDGMIEPKWVSGDFIPELAYMHIMMPNLAKFYPFLYLKTGTNIHDIFNISIFQFHSSTNDLNNEYCKRR